MNFPHYSAHPLLKDIFKFEDIGTQDIPQGASEDVAEGIRAARTPEESRRAAAFTLFWPQTTDIEENLEEARALEITTLANCSDEITAHKSFRESKNVNTHFPMFWRRNYPTLVRARADHLCIVAFLVRKR